MIEFFNFYRILDIFILDFCNGGLIVSFPFYFPLTFFLGFFESISLLTEGIFELCSVFKCWLWCLVVFDDLFTFDFVLFFFSSYAYFAKIVNFSF